MCVGKVRGPKRLLERLHPDSLCVAERRTGLLSNLTLKTRIAAYKHQVQYPTWWTGIEIEACTHFSFDVVLKACHREI